MKFIATADWQLGMTAHFLDDEARPRFQRARFDALVRIAQLAAENEASFVVVGGDVFESNQLDRAVVARTFEALKSFTVPVVLVPGNHDPLDAFSIYNSSAFTAGLPEHVHVLRDASPMPIIDGVEIVGAPWLSKRPDKDLVAEALAELDPAPKSLTRILVGHGAVDVLQPDRESLATISLESLQQALTINKVSFAVLGDRHGTYEVAPRIWYPGTPEVTARREIDPGNVLLVDLSDDTPKVDKLPTGAWKFLTIEETINSVEDIERFSERLSQIPEKQNTAVWLVLRGTLSIGARAQLDVVLDENNDLFALIELWERYTDLAVLADNSEFIELGLSGFAADALDELMEISQQSTEAGQTAQDALGLLYRIAGGAT